MTALTSCRFRSRHKLAILSFISPSSIKPGISTSSTGTVTSVTLFSTPDTTTIPTITKNTANVTGPAILLDTNVSLTCSIKDRTTRFFPLDTGLSNIFRNPSLNNWNVSKSNVSATAGDSAIHAALITSYLAADNKPGQSKIPVLEL